MEYQGKLYGKIEGMHFETGKTSADWDKLEEQVKHLQSAMNSEFNAFEKCGELQTEIEKLKAENKALQQANGVKSENEKALPIHSVMAMLPTTADVDTYKGYRSECFKGEYMFGLQTGIDNCYEFIKDWIRAKCDGNLP